DRIVTGVQTCALPISHSGWRATLNGLFDGAVWVVAYDRAVAENEPPRAWFTTFKRVVRMAEATGAITIPSRSGAHDRAVARISRSEERRVGNGGECRQ